MRVTWVWDADAEHPERREITVPDGLLRILQLARAGDTGARRALEVFGASVTIGAVEANLIRTFLRELLHAIDGATDEDLPDDLQVPPA